MWWAGSTTTLRGATDLSLTELAHWPWIHPASTAVRKVSDDLFGGAGLALTTSRVVETPSFLFALELMNTRT